MALREEVTIPTDAMAGITLREAPEFNQVGGMPMTSTANDIIRDFQLRQFCLSEDELNKVDLSCSFPAPVLAVEPTKEGDCWQLVRPGDVIIHEDRHVCEDESDANLEQIHWNAYTNIANEPRVLLSTLFCGIDNSDGLAIPLHLASPTHPPKITHQIVIDRIGRVHDVCLAQWVDPRLLPTQSTSVCSSGKDAHTEKPTVSVDIVAPPSQSDFYRWFYQLQDKERCYWTNRRNITVLQEPRGEVDKRTFEAALTRLKRQPFFLRRPMRWTTSERAFLNNRRPQNVPLLKRGISAMKIKISLQGSKKRPAADSQSDLLSTVVSGSPQIKNSHKKVVVEDNGEQTWACPSSTSRVQELSTHDSPLDPTIEILQQPLSHGQQSAIPQQTTSDNDSKRKTMMKKLKSRGIPFLKALDPSKKNKQTTNEKNASQTSSAHSKRKSSSSMRVQQRQLEPEPSMRIAPPSTPLSVRPQLSTQRENSQILEPIHHPEAAVVPLTTGPEHATPKSQRAPRRATLASPLSRQRVATSPEADVSEVAAPHTSYRAASEDMQAYPVLSTCEESDEEPLFESSAVDEGAGGL